MSKNSVEPEVADNMSHARCILDKYGYTPATTRTLLCTRTHALTHSLTHTHREQCAFLLFHGNCGYVNASLYYVTRALPALLLKLTEK
jgi:hypothetical protein